MPDRHFWGEGDSHDDYKQNITHGTIYFHSVYNKSCQKTTTLAGQQPSLKSSKG